MKKPALQATTAARKLALRLPKIDPMALGMVVGVALCIWGVMVCAHQLWMLHKADTDQQQLARLADWVVDSVAERFERERVEVAEAAALPEVRGYFLGTADAEQAQAAVEAMIGRSETVRVHLPNVEKTDFVDGISFAALDMLMRARESGTAPPVELHWFGTDRQRFSIVQPVFDGQNVIGLLEVGLPGSLLSEVVDVIDTVPSGYLDLRQGDGSWNDLVIKSVGRGGSAEQTDSLTVPGTMFRVTYGVGSSFMMLDTRNRTFLWSMIGACIVAAIGLVVVRTRLRKVKPVRAKEDSLADIVSSQPQEKIELDEKILRKIEQMEPGATQSRKRDGTVDANIDATMFRAYDIRGIVGEMLSADAAYSIGVAIGSEGQARGVSEICVARDGRKSGPMLSESLIDGLRNSGLDVIDIGAVPTPVLYFAAQHLGTASGVMVTGSHNPPDYNGFKIVLAGETLSGDDIQSLHQRIIDGDLSSGSGGVQEIDVVEDYIDAIAGDVQLEQTLKVVVDAGNGIAGAIAPRLLEEIGCEVVPLYCEVDGTFPNHHPDPSVPENLSDLRATVAKLDADLGVAFDGDGDRLGVISKQGEMVFPDRLLMLFARDVLSRKPGAAIIYDVKCTGHLAAEVLKAGGSPVMWKTGHSFIKGKMKEIGAELAGEMSGHFFFSERWYGFDDGLYAACRLLEILAADGREADEVFEELPQGVSTPELKIHTKEGDNYRFVDRFQKFANFETARITTIDGIRADFDDGWGLVRSSNTTPCLVLRFDADNEEALKRIQETFREQILAVDDTLELPF